MQIPKYIEDRVRRPIPDRCCVVRGTTPVISFGNAQTATVATLGLNPSKLEFLDKQGIELVGDQRRLATHSSLGTADLTSATVDVVERVVTECYGYFDKNPYRQWFDRLTPIIEACGASYYDETACHLDLVQWATDPTWGGLKSATIRKKLIQEDSHFLAEQLEKEHLRLLLVNGRGALAQLQRAFPCRLREIDAVEGHSHQPSRVFIGTVLTQVQVVAWTTNIQSSMGVKKSFAQEIGAIAAKTYVADTNGRSRTKGKGSETAGPAPSMEQIDALLPYLAVFEAEKFSPGMWSEPMEVLGPFLFDDRVSEFVETLYDQGWIDSTFDWTEWDARHEFAEQPEKIDSVNARTIQQLFTAHVRADRFCEGHVAALFESGVIVRMLRRLRELRETDLAPQERYDH